MFKGHGPDDQARKAKLLLDVRKMALRGGRSAQPAIVPGKPNESELVRRIFTNEDGEVMPPPAAKNSLSDKDKPILHRWIAAGAKCKQRWGFVEQQPHQAAE